LNIRQHRVHSEKKGIRVLAVAESFRRSYKKSILAGIVMRRDLVIDGVAFGSATIEGDDATDSIISIYRSLDRGDINCIVLDGLIISVYNIMDGNRIFKETGLPIIAITFEDSKGLEKSIKSHFPTKWQFKLEQYERLGQREKIILKTGKNLFVRCWGLSQHQTLAILNSFTLQGSVPEPIRVAKLVARALYSPLLHDRF
jgi:uncharacterized protein